jgi:hypothetical protein
VIQLRMEAREWAASSRGADAGITGRRTQKTVETSCPFCGAWTKIYVWSLAGSGKFCSCGAKFSSGGRCTKLVEIGT